MRWFRFYDDALNDPKVQKIAPPMFKSWVNLLCLASKNDGRIPPIPDVAFALRIAEGEAEKVVKALVDAGLIDTDDAGMSPHNWHRRQRSGDSAAERMRRHRERKRGVTSDGSDRNALRNDECNGDALEQSRAEQSQSRADASRNSVTQERSTAIANPEAVRIRQAIVALFGESEQTMTWHWSQIDMLLRAGFGEQEIMTAADKVKASGIVPKALAKYLRPVLDELRTPVKSASPKPKLNYARW